MKHTLNEERPATGARPGWAKANSGSLRLLSREALAAVISRGTALEEASSGEERPIEVRRHLVDAESTPARVELATLPNFEGHHDGLTLGLHSGLVNTLTTSRHLVEVLSEFLVAGQAGGREFEALREYGRKALATAWVLRIDEEPDLLAGMPVDFLLGQLAEATTANGVLEVDLSLDGETLLPPDVASALYRIARQVVGAVAKQAMATRARISLCCRSENAELTVTDNGDLGNTSVISICPAIGSIRAIASSIGASLRVEEQNPQGTRIAVVWSRPDPGPPL